MLILVCTVGCDQTAKHIARTELAHRGSVVLPGGFGEFRLAHNPGSFLSLGASLPASLRLGLLTIAVGVGLLGLLAYLAANLHLPSSSFIGLALVLAGGTSNLIDRISRHGFVTDFIYLRAGPLHTGIFNLADAVITAGIALGLCGLWRRRRSKRPAESPDEGNAA